MIGMLIQVGGVWVDPLAVVSVTREEWRETITRLEMSLRESGEAGEVLDESARWTYQTGFHNDNAEIVETLTTIRTTEWRVAARGVSVDEALQIINRCREQHMGAK